jgi:hypothetical protein
MIHGKANPRIFVASTFEHLAEFTAKGTLRAWVSMKTMWATLLHAHHPPIEPLLAELSLYLSEIDMTQVKQIASEIQQRISRFEERS